MNLFDSLAMSDVVELVLLCAVIFVPAGIYLSSHRYRLRLLAGSLWRFGSNLRDEGTFGEFIAKAHKRNGGQ